MCAQVAEEWTWLYASAVLEPLNTDAAFDQVVLSSKMLWFVVFTDGVYCGQCRTAMTNALRLSAGVAGMAKVGVVNCEEDSAQALCYERAGLPAPPHAPEVRIFKSGAKDGGAAPGYMGEVLYNPNDIQPHVALRLAELVARNALNHELPPSSVASSGGKGEYDSGATGDEDKQPPPPRRPEPMWNGPDAESLPKGIAWGGGAYCALLYSLPLCTLCFRSLRASLCPLPLLSRARLSLVSQETTVFCVLLARCLEARCLEDLLQRTCFKCVWLVCCSSVFGLFVAQGLVSSVFGLFVSWTLFQVCLTCLLLDDLFHVCCCRA